MRIVTGTFSHETNTFSNIPTSMEEFAKQRILHGADIPRRFRGTNAIEAAFLDAPNSTASSSSGRYMAAPSLAAR